MRSAGNMDWAYSSFAEKWGFSSWFLECTLATLGLLAAEAGGPRCVGRTRRHNRYCALVRAASMVTIPPGLTVIVRFQGKKPAFSNRIVWSPGARRTVEGVLPIYLPSTVTSAPGGSVFSTAVVRSSLEAGCAGGAAVGAGAAADGGCGAGFVGSAGAPG